LVVDEGGCKDSAETMIKVYPRPTIIRNSDILCENQSLEILASGGTGQLSYAANNGTFSPNNTFGNLQGESSIRIFVKDENNCIDSTKFQISKQPINYYTISTKNPTCGQNNGEIEFLTDETTLSFSLTSPWP